MYKVKQAVIMAAGAGERMRPVTRTVPKPLVTVRGVRMIDTVIRGLRANGIDEIYVVVGYRKEQFRPLEGEYPGLRLIENPYYGDANNISSLYVAREHLEDAMILDGDQIIYDQRVLAPEFERSGYNAVWTETETKEWLMTTENGIVTGCSRTGGAKGWQLYSISRWTGEDGRRLRGHLEEAFAKKENWGLYWDDLALFLRPEAYRLGVWEMQAGDVIEVDDIKELAALDAGYRIYLNGGIA